MNASTGSLGMTWDMTSVSIPAYVHRARADHRYEYFHFLFDLGTIDTAYSNTAPIGMAMKRTPCSLERSH